MSEFKELGGKPKRAHVISTRDSPPTDSASNNYKQCYDKNKLKFGSKPVLIVIDCVKAYRDPTSLYAPERFEIGLKSSTNAEKSESQSYTLLSFRRVGQPAACDILKSYQMFCGAMMQATRPICGRCEALEGRGCGLEEVLEFE
jgi:hypothetical protein